MPLLVSPALNFFYLFPVGTTWPISFTLKAAFLKISLSLLNQKLNLEIIIIKGAFKFYNIINAYQMHICI